MYLSYLSFENNINFIKITRNGTKFFINVNKHKNKKQQNYLICEELNNLDKNKSFVIIEQFDRYTNNLEYYSTNINYNQNASCYLCYTFFIIKEL